MYAIKVVLRPRECVPALERRLCREAGERTREDPQPGIVHVTLVSTPPNVVAMTFAVAPDLLAAERVAAAAWGVWLAGEWWTGWQLVSCAGDLVLNVWAVNESVIPDGDW
ncbi:hypothetical protein [Streptomyces laurentii]|uniref:hypothetical protein n=1 Tax=Streptomyces laurentii TaxID=39478 RepID=UPI0036832EB3